jgi:hypothetical protein
MPTSTRGRGVGVDQVNDSRGMLMTILHKVDPLTSSIENIIIQQSLQVNSFMGRYIYICMIDDHYIKGEKLLKYHYSREQTSVVWQKNHEHTAVLRLNPDTPVSHLACVWVQHIDRPPRS